jgi:hypothetical protein
VTVPSRLQVADPLPECLGCDQPTRRTTWTANGGLCSECIAATRRAAALRPLFDGER